MRADVRARSRRHRTPLDPSTRRDQILRHARAVFARKGYHDGSISDIVASARIARGTFYLYFKGKRDVFGTLLDGLLAELDARVQAVRLGPGQPPPLDQVRENVRRVLELMVNEPQNTRLLLHHANALDRRSREVLQQFFARLEELIERSLRGGMEIGLVRPCDTRVVAACALGMVREVVERMALGGSIAPDLDAVAGEIVQFGLNGIARRG